VLRKARLSNCSRLHLQLLVLVGYGPLFLCVIHKERLCPSSGDINGLMMMMYILGSMALRPVRFGVRSPLDRSKLSNVAQSLDEGPKNYYL
jgi:hypothetical protein